MGNVRDFVLLDVLPDADSDEEEVLCGIEHPQLQGNTCVMPYSHYEVNGSPHEDLAGNEWRGKPLD